MYTRENWVFGCPLFDARASTAEGERCWTTDMISAGVQSCDDDTIRGSLLKASAFLTAFVLYNG